MCLSIFGRAAAGQPLMRGRRINAMSSEKPFAGPAWDERILSLVDSGVDGTIIEENLRRRPTERLRRMQEMARFIELAEIAEIRRRSGKPT